MSEEIINVLDDLGKRFGIAIDWTSQNVLPYLQDLMGRFIAYKNAQAIIAIVAIIISIIIGVIIIKKAINWKKTDEFNYSRFSNEVDCDLIMMISTIAIIGCAIGFICNVVGLFQNIYMPELTIINYLGDLNY